MAKQNLLQSLDQTFAIIMDWATKFLQRKYWEKQADWFIVSSIIENLFRNIKNSNSDYERVFTFRRGWNNYLIATVGDIGKRTVLTVST